MKISNEQFKKYLLVYFNKNITELTLNDLQTIKSIGISNINPISGNREYDFNDLNLCHNLIEITIADSVVNIKDIDVIANLPNIKNVNFIHCIFESDKEIAKLSNLRGLNFKRCAHSDFNYLSQFSQLRFFGLDKPYNDIDFDFRLLQNNIYLEDIYMNYDILKNEQLLAKFRKLKKIIIQNSEINDLSFINYLQSGVDLVIPLKYYDEDVVKNNKGRISVRTDIKKELLEEEEFYNR